MKLYTLLSAFLLTVTLSAQTSVTVSTGPGNAAQTFYSLANGEQGSAELASWDLAFEISGFTSAIRVNTAKGVQAFETPAAISEWSTVSAPDEANWQALYDSETYWSESALSNGNNLSEPDGFNVGWGTYNIITHTIAGSKVYVVVLLDGTYRKLRINSLASGTYSFTHSLLDGTDEQTVALSKSNYTGKNFGYYSFDMGVMDLEPASATWDLVFTKYTSIIPFPAPTAYPVAGVLQNKTVDALQVDGVDPMVADWNSAPFDSSMNIIGYDWKTFNMETFVYEYPTDRTYFVADRTGNIWKLIFIEYGGSANGDMTFTQELVSSVGMNESAPQRDLVIYPNPSSDGRLNIVLDTDVRNGVISIFDMNGKRVGQQQVNGTGSMALLPLDLNGLEHGIYLVRLVADGVQYTSRVVLQ